MLDPNQLRQYIVRPTLERLVGYSKVAEDAVMGTAAQESRLTWIKQLGGGPALGLWQMEPATHEDIWDNWLDHRPQYWGGFTRQQPEVMMGDLFYACFMCRMHYYRRPEPLPPEGDEQDPAYLEALGTYWKNFYNTQLGAGTVPEFISNYQELLLT